MPTRPNVRRLDPFEEAMRASPPTPHFTISLPTLIATGLVGAALLGCVLFTVVSLLKWGWG